MPIKNVVEAPIKAATISTRLYAMGAALAVGHSLELARSANHARGYLPHVPRTLAAFALGAVGELDYSARGRFVE